MIMGLNLMMTPDKKVAYPASIRMKALMTQSWSSKRINKIIAEFRSKFSVEDKKKISDTKVLDFIIWSLGKIKNKK